MKPDRNEHGALEEAISALRRADQSSKKTIEQIRHAGDNQRMSDPLTRPELDAKLETIEARMDGRLVRIEDRFASIDRQFSDLRSMLSEQKNTAWKAAGATIGVFVGVFAIYVAAFDSGRETSKVAADAQIKAAEAQAQTSAALAEIRQIVNDMKAQPPGPPAQQ